MATDDDAAVARWRDAVAKVGSDAVVLDDLAAESAAVASRNPWLCYGAALHRLREFGAAPRCCDFLATRALSVSEVADVARLVVGPGVPDPARGAGPFLKSLALLQAAAEPIWDPCRARLRPALDVARLEELYGGEDACPIM